MTNQLDTGMREVIIDNEADLKRIEEACAKGGHSMIACVSNAGLKPPLMRVTIVRCEQVKEIKS